MSETIQIQADWGQTDSTQIDFIKNKPVFYEEWWGTQADYDAILVKDPNKIYNIETPEVLPNYFYVEDISGAGNTVSITKSDASAPDVTVYYSTDTNNWTLMGTTDITPISVSFPADGKLYLKCTATKWGSGDSVYNAITASGNHKVGGNIMSLVYGDDFDGQTTFPANSAWCLSSLFRNSTNLTSAANLQLPATTLVERCYQYMFEGCTSLTTPPTDLPATTLASTCYAHMFYQCTSLTTTPALPATTLADNCYNVMFYRCTSLSTAPALPATTLTYGCYIGMFQSCSALTVAPVLPATTLAEHCYENMFQGCRALTTAPSTLPATTMAERCYSGMFSNTALTTAPVLPATTLASYCYANMFTSCTSLTTAPALPATTLAYSCYAGMFQSCTSLTTAPALPATTLTTRCYAWMFGRSGVTTVTTYAQDISASGCLSDWLTSVPAQGDFYNLGGATYTADSGSGIPTGWTEHNSL